MRTAINAIQGMVVRPELLMRQEATVKTFKALDKYFDDHRIHFGLDETA
jgi:hypothetical protein